MNRKLCEEFLRAIGVAEEYKIEYVLDMLEFIEKHPNAKMVMSRKGPMIVLPDNIIMHHPELTKTEGRVCNK